jgi:EthD domain
VGRDDTTELYFRDWDHVLASFRSPYVKEKIAPDAPLFADFETSIVLMAYEKPLSVQTRLQEQNAGVSLDEGNATVAIYFISTKDNVKVGDELEQILSPALKSALELHAQDDVYGLIANVGTVSSKFDLNAYFGGSSMPQYALMYKVFLKGNESVPVFRRAQKAFVKEMGEHFDVHESFVLFAKEALVLDVAKNARVGEHLLQLL